MAQFGAEYPVVTETTKNNISEAEHVDIVNAIDTLTREKNRLPACCEAEEKTSLSQETIQKHIGEYFQIDHHKQRQQEFLLMRERLLSHCYKFAINGDMKAARLFLEAPLGLLFTSKLNLKPKPMGIPSTGASTV